MIAAGLVSSKIEQLPSFDVIIEEFTVGLNSKNNFSEIEQHCAIFLSILTNSGGPCAVASKILQQDWIKDSRAKCGVELQLGM